MKLSPQVAQVLMIEWRPKPAIEWRPQAREALEIAAETERVAGEVRTQGAAFLPHAQQALAVAEDALKQAALAKEAATKATGADAPLKDAEAARDLAVVAKARAEEAGKLLQEAQAKMKEEIETLLTGVPKTAAEARERAQKILAGGKALGDAGQQATAEAQKVEALALAAEQAIGAAAGVTGEALAKAKEAKAKADNALKQAQTAEQELSRAVEAERQRIKKELAAVKDPEGANSAHRQQLGEKRKKVDAELDKKPASAETIGAAKTQLKELGELVQRVTEEVKKLLERKAKLKTTYQAYQSGPDAAADDQIDRIRLLRTNFVNLLGGELIAAGLDEAERAREKLKEEYEAVQKEVAQTKVELDALFTGVEGSDKVADLAKHFGAKTLKGLVADLGGPKAAGALAKEYSPAELKSLCADLGGAKAAGTFLAEACGGRVDTLKALQGQFGGTKGLVDLVNNQLGGKAKILGGLLRQGCGGDAARFKKVLDGFGGDLTDLKNLVDNGGFGAAADPEALGQIMGAVCTRDEEAGKFKEFCTTFKDPANTEKLRKLLIDGGLGAKPGCLREALAVGCGKDLEKFRQLTSQLNYPEIHARLKVLTADPGGLGDRPEVFGHLLADAGTKADPAKARLLFEALDDTTVGRLNELIKDGGLAAGHTEPSGEFKYDVKPDCLGKLLKTGCGGRPAELKKFIDAYTTPEERAGLKKTLVEGGLGTRPECLGQALATGFDGATDMKEGAKRFKEFAAKLDEPPASHAKLQRMLGVDKGLGDEPEVFGQLLAVGCDKKPEKARDLLKAFDDDGLDNLNKLVKDGGFGKHKAGAEEVKPECLGQLLAIGCDGQPAALQTLVKGLNDDDRTHLKGMMQKGSLGKEPKVLGHMYKTGCPTKPGDLHDLCEQFKTEADQKKLGGLLERGGLDGRKGTSQRPETLGEIMKEGFKDRGKSPGEQLKKLHDAFNPPPAGPDELAKLQTTVRAFNFTGAAQGIAGKPGTRFKTLMKHFNDDVSEIKMTYYAKLDAQAKVPPAHGSNPPSTAAPLGLDLLLANAATFEVDPLPGPLPNPATVPADLDETDMAHFCSRHTRQYQTLNPPDVNPGNQKDTTLWPEGTTADDIATYVSEANAAVKAQSVTQTRKNPPGGNLTKGANVELSKAHVSSVVGNQTQVKNVATTGGNVTIGYKYISATGELKNGQFYPEPSGGLTTINHGDMTAIKEALKK